MKSPEYPDLDFVRPASYDVGRPERIRVIVVHTTEGHEDDQAAESGAHYDGIRTDGTSAHYYHDPDSTVQCVLTTDRAHTARYHGNRIGIHHELCGSAKQSAVGWGDAASQAIIRRAAKQAARDAARWQIPIRRLTSAEVRNGALGFCGHNEITLAFPEDNGTHWDPGTSFPWPFFLSLVEQYTNGEDDMPSVEEIADAVKTAVVNRSGLTVGVALEDAAQTAPRVERIEAAVNTLVARPGQTVVLSPDQLGQLADAVVARLTATELVWKSAA